MEPPLRSFLASTEVAMSSSDLGNAKGYEAASDVQPGRPARANHFSAAQVEELAARLEDARLAMEADQPPARPAPGSGPQRLWLAGGRAASPQRDLEFRALRATAWTDFTQEEVAAMRPVGAGRR